LTDDIFIELGQVFGGDPILLVSRIPNSSDREAPKEVRAHVKAGNVSDLA